MSTKKSREERKALKEGKLGVNKQMAFKIGKGLLRLQTSSYECF